MLDLVRRPYNDESPSKVAWAVAAAVTSARFRELTLETAAWLEIGGWTNPHDDLVRDRGAVPIETFAAEQLTRRWRKVRKKGRTLAQLDGDSRHKLRIQVKKLRYATEFFATLFAGKRTSKQRQKFLSALEAQQHALGDLNDIAVHEHVIAALGADRRRMSPKRAFAAGLLTGRECATRYHDGCGNEGVCGAGGCQAVLAMRRCRARAFFHS